MMDSSKSDDQIIKGAIALLSSLISPIADESESLKTKIKEFDDALHARLSSVVNSEHFKSLTQDLPSGETWSTSDSRIHIRWNFVRTCLQLMGIIRDTISRTEDDRNKLLSVAEKKVLEKTFQFVMSLAVLPYLLPGVGVSLGKKCRHFADVKPEKLKDFAKYRRLCFTIDAILNLRSVDVFHEIIISRHLEDVFAALFQLSFVPFKKPVPHDLSEAITQINLESLDENYEIDTMTYSLWTGLENNRKRFGSKLEELQNRLYRPLVIRNYMILLGSKGIPRWMRKNLTNVLTGLFLEEDGVISAVKGIIDVDNESPVFSTHCTTVAKLISKIFCEENESKLELLKPQIEKILSKEKKESYDYVYINVIASAVGEVLKIDPEGAQQHLLNPMLNPLRSIVSSSEEEISKAIIQVHNLCVTPSNKMVAVPISVLEPISLILCFVYAHIKGGICYLKTPTKEVLGRYLREADTNTLSRFLDGAVFREHVSPEIVPIPTDRKIVLSPDGGVNITEGEASFAELECGMMLFQLMKELEDRENLISSLFTYLLEKYIHFSGDGSFAKERFIIVFLLAQLSQDTEALKHILKDAENIILFVRELLNIHYVEDEQNADVIRVCLTFLLMVLFDVRKKENVNWKILASLLPPLDKLRNSHLPDIMVRAEEVRNLIATRNTIGGVASDDIGKSNPLIEEITQSACEKAIEDACDDLLPVRAHALMELIELLKKGDVETLAKKEKIFVVFEENLKDEDSFLYLRAIEGLACLALLMPDNVLPLLCQGFQGFSLSSTIETRLKIGETLMRTVKAMNDFILPHKHLLINTFMNGAKDIDSAVRASSLSNLSELCLTLQWNIEDVLYEIIECARETLFDPDIEPRRAAVLLIGSLFRGYKTATLEVRRLLELYRTLRHIRSNEDDEVMRTQSQLSLDNLNEIMKDFLVTKPAMEKKIHILDYSK